MWGVSLQLELCFLTVRCSHFLWVTCNTSDQSSCQTADVSLSLSLSLCLSVCLASSRKTVHCDRLQFHTSKPCASQIPEPLQAAVHQDWWEIWPVKKKKNEEDGLTSIHRELKKHFWRVKWKGFCSTLTSYGVIILSSTAPPGMIDKRFNYYCTLSLFPWTTFDLFSHFGKETLDIGSLIKLSFEWNLLILFLHLNKKIQMNLLQQLLCSFETVLNFYNFLWNF